VTRRARWVKLRARWVTLGAHWVTLKARWVTLWSSLGDAKSSLGDFQVLHEVMPAHRTRLAMTLWLFGEPVGSPP
jgi:hypothetical protein